MEKSLSDKTENGRKIGSIGAKISVIAGSAMVAGGLIESSVSYFNGESVESGLMTAAIGSFALSFGVEDLFFFKKEAYGPQQDIETTESL